MNAKLHALIAATVTLLAAGQAYATCSGPTAPAGATAYSSNANMPVYCDGTNWVSMSGGVSVTIGGTTNNYSGGTPGGSSGQVQFNSGGSFAGDSGLTYSGGVLAASTIIASTVSGSSGLFTNIGSTGTSTLGTVTANSISSTYVYGNVASFTTLYVGGVAVTGGGGGGGGTSDRITSSTTSVVAQSGGLISITTAGTTTGYFNSNGVLTVPGISATANLTSVTSLYASGNVGIGTTAPATALHVYGGSGVNSAVKISSNAGATNNILKVFDGTGLQIQNGNSVPMMSFDNSNFYVGIGMASPTKPLDVSGSIKTSGVLYGGGATSNYGALTIDGTKNSWGGINFKSAGTNLKTLMVNGTYSGVYNTADNGWDWLWSGGTLNTGTVPAANISAGTLSGNFTVSGALYRTYGYNGVEYDGNNTAYYVDPNVTSAFNDVRVDIIYARTNTGYYIQPQSDSNFYNVHMQYFCSPSYGCQSANWVGAAADPYSDKRLKENIKPLSDDGSTLMKLMKLKPVSFDWRDRNIAKEEGHQYGFIAQDMEEVFPDLVKSSIASTTITMENGKKEVIEKPLSLDYKHMIAPVVRGLQELKTLFDGDHAAIATLQAENTQLKALVAKQGAAIEALEKRVGK